MTTGINLGRQDINRFYTKYQEKERRSQILFIAVVGYFGERTHEQAYTETEFTRVHMYVREERG